MAHAHALYISEHRDNCVNKQLDVWFALFSFALFIFRTLTRLRAVCMVELPVL